MLFDGKEAFVASPGKITVLFRPGVRADLKISHQAGLPCQENFLFKKRLIPIRTVYNTQYTTVKHFSPEIDKDEKELD
jgi:hypothetical protein